MWPAAYVIAAYVTCSVCDLQRMWPAVYVTYSVCDLQCMWLQWCAYVIAAYVTCSVCDLQCMWPAVYVIAVMWLQRMWPAAYVTTAYVTYLWYLDFVLLPTARDLSLHVLNKVIEAYSYILRIPWGLVQILNQRSSNLTKKLCFLKGVW